MRELTPQERIDVVRYRTENAHKTLDEVQSHIEKGYYNTAVNRMYYDSNLFEKRTKGDYEDLFDNNLTTCSDLYPKAKEFVETVEALINNNSTK